MSSVRADCDSPLAMPRIRAAVGKTFSHPVVIAVLAAVLGALIAWRANIVAAGSDANQLLAGARYLMHGVNPYTHVGPGLASPWPWPLYYPVPALIIEMPFALLRDNVARIVFTALSSGLLGFAVARTGYHRLILFASPTFFNAAERTQLAPLLMAAALWPALGFVYAAKPNIGAALWAAKPSRIAALGSTVLIAVSFALQPTWLTDWLHASPMSPHLRPAVLYPFGWLLLLAAFGWRRRDARLLLFFSLIPQTLAEYAALPLFLVTKTRREALVLLVGTAAVTLYVHAFHAEPTDMAYIASSGRAMVLTCFLPCLVMVLRRSPDRPSLREGDLDEGAVSADHAPVGVGLE